MGLSPALPIGIFDSGLGGLTIVKAIQQQLPGESTLYVGDTAHLPYGDKSELLIQEYSAEITHFLVQKGVKAIIIACNTASAIARKQVIQAAGDIPVFDVIIPAVRHALAVSTHKNIGVIGTRATIRSGEYQRQLIAAHPSDFISVVEKATPMLVPMIEEGWLNNQVSQEVIDAYMSDTGFQNIDTLILGCTHYPLIKKQIENSFTQNSGHPAHIVDSSFAVASFVKEALQLAHALAPEGSNASHQYYLTDYNQHFQSSASMFLGQAVHFEKTTLLHDE